MRWDGCKDVCFFGLLSLQVLVRRQFACAHHSVKMEWGVKKNHVTAIILHNCGKSHYQIFKLLKPLTILWMFIYWAIKHYKELWRVENRARSGRLKSVRAEAAIKTVWEWIRQNLLWKQKIMFQKLNISTQSSYASSGMIYTWQRNSTQKDTLLLLGRRSDGQEQCVSSSGMPKMGTKTFSSWMRKSTPSRSSITTRTTRCSKIPWGALRRCHRLVGGDTIFARKGWNWCLTVSTGCATRSCETS